MKIGEKPKATRTAEKINKLQKKVHVNSAKALFSNPKACMTLLGRRFSQMYDIYNFFIFNAILDRLVHGRREKHNRRPEKRAVCYGRIFLLHFFLLPHISKSTQQSARRRKNISRLSFFQSIEDTRHTKTEKSEIIIIVEWQ